VGAGVNNWLKRLLSAVQKIKEKLVFKFPHMTKHKKERKPQMFDMKTFHNS
jgi:hypothetical protein